MRRARGQLKGPLAIASLVLLAGCSRAVDAVPAGATDRPAAAAAAAAPSTAAPVTGSPGAQSAAALDAATAGSATVEATSATAPLGVRVVAVRRESADSIRVELALANLAAAEGWSADAPEAKALQAAVDALDGASVLSADGRRRMFALRDASGGRVGSPAAVPQPGRPETYWTLFPAAEGRVSVLLPGFAPFAGLAVAPR